MTTQGEKALEFYRKKFAKYGVDPKSLSWKSLGASHQRFRQIWKELNFDNKSVLDVGCGFGEMARFLHKRYQSVDYTGVDIVPEFISIASETHPYYKFEARDFFSNPLEDKFDIVMAVGVMNSNLDNENMEFRRNAIESLFDSAREVATFSMLGAYPQPTNDPASNVWYADSHEIVEFAKTLSDKVIVRDKYHPRDFTVFMYR